jgi:hypothetical protein
VGDKTVALVFDMHNDYGRQLKFAGGRRRSLRDRHPTDVCLYSLEANVPGQDGWVEIGTSDIEPEDLAVLQTTGHFTAAAIECAHECMGRFGKRWVDDLLEVDPSPRLVRTIWGAGEEPEELNWARVATRIGAHQQSLDNLRRGLRAFQRRQVVRAGSGQFGGGLNHIVQTLQGGKSVVIQFGRHAGDLKTYMLVANMLSRRIWDAYRSAVERSEAVGRGEEPNRLVIVIEEAHKFIDRALAGQSIFGQIARELRKYNVTLLVIDQRPSQIDAEVLSQIGTKFCFQLDSDSDVEALVGGVAGRAALRQIIAALESQQQALAFGHALSMPVVIRPPDLRHDSPPGEWLRSTGMSGGPRPPLRERLQGVPGDRPAGNPLFR